MARPELFLTWVKCELPWLYDKNTDYNDSENCYVLLTKVKNYYTNYCQNAEGTAYNQILWLHSIKTDQTTRFLNSYDSMSPSSTTESFDQLAKNGILSDPLNTYQLLEEKLNDLILPIGG